MKVVRIGFYHHGAVAAEADAKALAGINVSGRNAERFNPNELEAFDSVVVDDGPKTDAIKNAYGDKAMSVAEFVKKTPAVPAATPAPGETFNPDAKPVKPKGKVQGKPKAKPRGK